MIRFSAATLALLYLLPRSEAERSEVGLLLVAGSSFPPFASEMVEDCSACWVSSARGLHKLFFSPFFPPHPGLPTGWHGWAILLS